MLFSNMQRSDASNSLERSLEPVRDPENYNEQKIGAQMNIQNSILIDEEPEQSSSEASEYVLQPDS